MEWFSAVTMAPVSRAARTTASSSSGLIDAMLMTRTSTPSCASVAAASSDWLTSGPPAMMVRSPPSRTWQALPSWKR